MDPEVAMAGAGIAIMRIEAKTGLRIPGDELLVLQAGATYQLTSMARRPKTDDDPTLLIFHLKEVA
jgi:hypothetical protein